MISLSKQRYAEFLFAFNKIETTLNLAITSFFVDDGDSYWRSIVLGGALNDNSIISGFKNKLAFVERINRSLREYADAVGYDFDFKVWKDYRKEIEEVMELRNQLAHKHITFSFIDTCVSYEIYKKGSTQVEACTLDLDPLVDKVEDLYSRLSEFSSFLKEENLNIRDFPETQSDLR